jgi:hypothetical protein
VVAGGVALMADKTTGPWIVPAILLAGVLGGMAWAGLTALLRDKFNANEILVSLMPGEFVSKADVSEHLKAAWGSALQEYEKQENMLNDASDQLVVNVAAEREKSKKHVLAASGSKPFEIPDGGQQGHGDKAFQYGGAPPQPVVLGDDDDPKANHDLQNIGGDDNYGDDDND